ncbi:nodulation protein NfeD [Rhodohalobacter sp. SW132]|uniref:NfeD family protein n=1 Tax=Rhodohalobacter sp. SW132 TaxID=2293433 RepID=UPI000E27D905|nr:nodulation protein NfeD [Rhodohalobacter sp. SW132]REL38938.1 nodulation protein NfeD [Rhodohalobacter sp. SW132]
MSLSINKTYLISAILFLVGTAFVLQDNDEVSQSADRAPGTVSILSVSGTIGPTTAQYIQRGLRKSQERGDELLVIELDTPGGLLDSTQKIVQELLGSSHPIVVYVTPQGANAGSAGTFITLAAHIAAMSPATNIGAASPVAMGGGEMDTVSQQKIFNFSESYIETIAERRGRNAEWAKSAVRDGDSITADQALEINVIDLIADNLEDLLREIDGMEVEGETLRTEGAAQNRIPQNFAEIFFSFLIRPEVMLILTLVAIYGIIGEVTNPGGIVPGMAGAIALILLLYGVAAMPVNIAGFLLIGLAILLFVAEAFTPAFGLLIAGGAVSFFLGALMLFQDLPEEMQVSWYWLIPATLLTVLFFAWIVSSGIKAQFRGLYSGIESEVGRVAEVSDRITPEMEGRVFHNGEYWRAVSDEVLEEGDKCVIVEFEGLKVFVKSKTNQTENNEELSNG